MDDGSVEIVALADSDLAAIAPKAPRNAHAMSMNATPAQAALAAPRAQTMAANPYASGMPDVFSSVFGASPEAGAETMGNSGNGNAGSASTSDLSTTSRSTDTAPATSVAAEQPSARAAASRLTEDLRADLLKAVGVSPATAAEMPAPRTMAESNPWLIDHARRIAAEQQQPAEAIAASAMTPAAAMAKGLGAAVEPVKAAARAATPTPAFPKPAQAAAARVGETPDWAREAAQIAARRAMPKTPASQATQTTQATHAANDDARSSSAVADAIRTRMEQVVNETVMSELSSMRGMMEEHFAGLLWSDRQRRNPTRAALTKHLFAAGFSAQLVQMMVDNLPDELADMDGGMDWVRSVLESNLPVMEDEDALMERGGVFALMGPTGVGKTTTTAKLAARCVMRFGASKVALLTTDSYRIGGHEQLRIFGKILGVSVHAVKDGADLQLALSELRNKHIVLIDTIGMSQRDRLVSEQIAMLCRAGQPVQRLLLLNATSHGDTLNEVVQAYQRAPDQQPLAGCILTKLDEATNLGGVLDTVIRYKLPVHYVSTGQKVPENLYVATRKFLIKSAFCIPRDHSPFVPQDDDIPALLSALSARSTSELHEVRFA